jgi:hypothetical protein
MRQGSQAPVRSQNPPFSSHRQFKVSVSKQIRSGKAGLRNVMPHDNLSWRQPIALIQLGLFAKVRITDPAQMSETFCSTEASHSHGEDRGT